MKVALLAFIDEYEAFLAYLREKELNVGDFVIVALEPKLQVYLTKLGIRYKNTLPYFNNDSHKRIIVETEKTMELIREKFSFIDRNGLTNAYREEFAVHLRRYLNHLFKLIEISANIYAENTNYEIYASVERGVSAGSVRIADDGRYHGLLAMAFAESKNARFVDTNLEKAKGALGNRKGRTRGIGCKQLERVLTRCVIWAVSGKKVILIPARYRSFRSLCQKIGRKSRGVVFLSLDSTRSVLLLTAYNIISYLKSIVSKTSYQRFIVNTNFLYSAPEDEREKNALIANIDSIVDSEMESLCTYKGVNCLDFVKGRVNGSIKNTMVQMLQGSHNIAYLFKSIGTKMIMKR